MTRLTPLVSAILLLLAGCARSSQPAAAPGPGEPEAAADPAGPGTPTGQAKGPATGKPTASETGGLGAPKVAWKDKTREQRMEYMGLFVLDRMHELFAEWKPAEYAGENKFRCQNCHGESFDKPPVDFHMPRVAFPLKPDDPVGGAMKYDPAAAKFMVEKVVPTMAKLLNEEPYDPATGKGTFGCFRCHPKKGEKAP